MGKRQSRLKDTQEQEEEEESGKPTALLIGGRDAGSSTLAKQMRLLGDPPGHDWGKHVNDVREHFALIMSTLAEGCLRMGISDDQSLLLKGNSYELVRLNWAETSEKLKYLCQHEAIRKAVDREAEITDVNNSMYLIENVDRICGDDYKPTTSDIIRCRVASGLLTFDQPFNSEHQILELGGRNKARFFYRRNMYPKSSKFLLVYMCSASEFVSQSSHGYNMTSLKEQHYSFEEYCSRWEQDETLLLFTKMDVFRDYIAKGYSITSTFPDYTGPPDDADQSIAFIKKKFFEVTKGKSIHTLEANLLDVECVKGIVSVVNEILSQK